MEWQPTAGDKPVAGGRRKHLEWTPERMRKWSLQTGPYTERLTRDMLGRVRHPEKRYRACLGIIRLSQRYGADRMEAAARRALHFGSGAARERARVRLLRRAPRREGR